MKIEYSFANQAYIILFGDTIIDIDNKRFFESKQEIKDYIKYKGLKIKGNKIIAA